MNTTRAGQPGDQHFARQQGAPPTEEQPFLSLAEEGLRRGLRVRYRWLGREMAPTVADGEWLVVEPIAPVSVRQGDVVLVTVEQGLAVRRVVAVREHPVLEEPEYTADFALRADARGSQIGVVPGHRIVGRVVAVDRGDRLVSLDAPPETRKRNFTNGIGVPLVIAAVAAAAAALIGVLPLVRGNDAAASTSVTRPR